MNNTFRRFIIAAGILVGALVPAVTLAQDESSAGDAVVTPPANAARWKGILPAKSSPGAAMTENDAASLLAKLAKLTGKNPLPELKTLKSSRLISRARLIGLMAKTLLPEDTLSSYTADPDETMPADFKLAGSEDRPAIAAAVGEGWIVVDRPIRPKQFATWEFVQTLLKRISPPESAPTAAAHEATTPSATIAAAHLTTVSSSSEERCTGLIIEVSGIKISRCSSPRLLDEEGEVLYPAKGHIPSDEFVDDKGLAAYCQTDEETDRAGKHPLRVKALRLGTTPFDLVVSKEDAERIHKENGRSRFLYRWSVCILTVKEKPPVETASKTIP